MAERRMFTKAIIDSDAFLDMPLSTQALYFHLAMRADDDGFLNNAKRIQRTIGCSEDDLRLLVAKNFIIPFDTGVIVIKHWRMHNYIQKDRRKETAYKDELAMLEVKENGAYTLNVSEMYPECVQDVSNMYPTCIQTVSKMDSQVSIGKDSIGKDRLVKVSKGKRKNEDSDNKSSSSSCSELTAVTAEPMVVKMVLNDGSFFGISQPMIDDWSNLYPAVDVMQQLRSMVGWLDANPSKRKTKSGIKRFINNWLAREQDRGPRPKSYAEKIENRVSEVDSWV